MQSLKAFDDVEAFFSKYGFIIVDECHHLPAFTFEACVKKAPVRYLLGLTATLTAATVCRRLLPCSADQSATQWRRSKTVFLERFLFVRLSLHFRTMRTHPFKKFSVAWLGTIRGMS
jgi:hypothetical protein